MWAIILTSRESACPIRFVLPLGWCLAMVPPSWAQWQAAILESLHAIGPLQVQTAAHWEPSRRTHPSSPQHHCGGVLQSLNGLGLPSSGHHRGAPVQLFMAGLTNHCGLTSLYRNRPRWMRRWCTREHMSSSWLQPPPSPPLHTHNGYSGAMHPNHLGKWHHHYRRLVRRVPLHQPALSTNRSSRSSLQRRSPTVTARVFDSSVMRSSCLATVRRANACFASSS
jgi:hypothetical protein